MKENFKTRFNYKDSRPEEFPSAITTNAERAKKVDNREAKPKYFHASGEKYKVGDIIKGTSTNSEISKPSVFLTDDPKPHFTLGGRKEAENYTIYKVVPIEGIKPGFDWADLASGRVRVVEVLGSAKGLLHGRKFSEVSLKEDHDRGLWLKNREDLKLDSLSRALVEMNAVNGKKLLKKIEDKYGPTRSTKKHK